MLKLHSYYRSSAAYRVRIALSLKNLAFETIPHHLRRGEHRSETYRAINPQALVPALETESVTLTQSLAICEYLDEVYPDPPLLPHAPAARARARGFADIIACDIHPLQNLRILKRLKAMGIDQEGVDRWAIELISEGLDACETMIRSEEGPFCFGAHATLADICLVPQLYNARRFGIALRWPRLLEAEAISRALPAFHAAAPEQQPDWEEG
jgi:maleylpyruvate isomerase